MGEEADDMIDRMILDWDNRSFSEPRKRRGFQKGTGNFMWRQADGELINMYDMTPTHRENAMRICQQRGNTGKYDQLAQVQREMAQAKGDRRRPERPAKPVFPNSKPLFIEEDEIPF